MVVLLVLSLVLLFLTIDYFVQRSAAPRLALESGLAGARSAAPQAGELPAAVGPHGLPAGAFLSPGHVWLRVEPEGSVLVGVDRLLLDLLGGVDHVYTLDEGSEVQRGGPLFMLRRGSRALKVRSPLAGRVSAINSEMSASPASLVQDPFGAGWVYRIAPQALPESLRATVSGSEAAAFLRRELGRLRDLASELVGPPLEGLPVLADGGPPATDLAERVGDREWEELVTRFFAAAEKNEGAVLPFPRRDGSRGD